MADDIDIEEHDVLDNPRIKHIFPELTKIKTEVLDIDEQANRSVNFTSKSKTAATATKERLENIRLIQYSKKMAARGKNYTEREKATLLNIINKYKQIVENKQTTAVILVMKQKAWQKITKEYNLTAETPRSTKQLVTAYLNSKRTAKKLLSDTENLKKMMIEENTEHLISDESMEVGDDTEDMFKEPKKDEISIEEDVQDTAKLPITQQSGVHFLAEVVMPLPNNSDTDTVPVPTTQVKDEIPYEITQYVLDNLDYEPSHSSHEESPEIRPRGNKIILGSKPCSSSPNVSTENPLCFGYQREIKQELIYEDDLLANDGQHGNEGDTPTEENMSSVIILGSRLPDEVNDNQLPDEDDYVNIPKSVVFLQDWGPRLECDPCFCHECKILFPTRNCLDAHNSTVHSFLVAVAVNKAFKSTSKPPTFNTVVKSTARKSTGFNESPSSSRFCNHCNKLFDSDTELITHLYENLTGNIKCQLCDATFDDDVKLKSHMETHADDDMFYKCDICYYYTKFKGQYERHVFDNHDVSKANFVKHKYEGQCPFCTQIFETSHTFNRHIKEIHKVAFQKKVTNEILPSTFKANKTQIHHCRVCNLNFNHPFSLKTHLQRKHGEVYSKMYPKLIFQNESKVIVGNDPEIPKTTITNPLPLTFKQLIPKNSLFKCKTCNLHFTSATLALAHTKVCKNLPGEWTCNKCRIQFKITDKNIHTEQHKFVDTFRIHPIDDNLYKKILCKCPDCNGYCDEASFWQHCKTSCDSKNTFCNICDWPINDKCFKQHQKVHSQFDIVNEFVRITYKKVQVIERKKRKQDAVFNYCQTCNCVVRGAKYMDYHKLGSCYNDKHASKIYICKICGLMVRSKRHDEFHVSHPNIKIFDMKFIRISDQKPIGPPVPTYPKCGKCKVCFLSKMALNKHDCTDNYRTCSVCLEKFSDLAYKLHMPFHGSQYVPPSKNTAVKKVVMPKLIEKYKTMAQTWNFLYLCKVCDIVADSYDGAVEHCQNHFNNLENYDVTIMKCNICNFKFDSPCYDRHELKHSTNKSLNQQSFKVFDYDFNMLFNNDSWYELFQDLPSTEIDKITSNSVYRYVRSLRMKVFSPGAAEFTVYKCDKCKRFVNPPMAILHYHNCKGNPIAVGHRCYQCNSLYSSVAGLKFHAEQHKSYDGTQMRIVLFNSYADKDFNKTLNETCKTQPKLFKQPKVTLPKVGKKLTHKVLTKKGPTIVYYKCMKCKCCSREASLAHHVCKLKQRKQCPKCKLWFSSNLSQHIQRHQNSPNFRYKVVPLRLDVTKRRGDSRKRLFRCICDLHFITSHSLEEHVKKCDSKNPIPSEVCSKCSRRFPTTILVNHLLLHHANNKYPDLFVDTITADGALYKCGKCNVHFASETVLKTHYIANHVMDFEVASCYICSLHFPLADIHDHEEMYHKKTTYIKVNTYNPDRFVFDGSELVSMALFRKELVKLDCYNSELFKCTVCKVNFLTYSRFYSHMANNLKNTDTAYCDLCGLLFSKSVLPVHKYAQHEKLGLNAEDFDIKEMGDRSSYKSKQQLTCPNKRGDDVITPVNTVESDEESAEVSDIDKSITDEVNKIEIYQNYTKYLYKCDICHVHLLTPTSLNKHQQFCGTKRQKRCNMCKLTFYEKSLSKHVNIHHKKMNLRKKDLIVTNIYGLKETTVNNKSVFDNIVVKPISAANDTVMSNFSELNDTLNTTPTNPNKYKLSTHCCKYAFKCIECSLRFLSESHLIQHINIGNHEDTSKDCDICNAKYHSKTYGKHVLLHHQILGLKPEDIHIVTCYKRVDSVVHDCLFKCHKCEVCFMKENSFQKHLFLGCKRDLSKRELCDICNQYFSPKLAETHKEIQHDYLKLTAEDIVLIDDTNVVNLKNPNRTVFTESVTPSEDPTDRKNFNKVTKTLYKCKTCNLCFLKANALKLHFNSNHLIGKVKQCDICHYRFSKHSFPNHMHYQHEVAKLSRKHLQVLGFVKETFNSFYNKSDFIITEKTKSKLRQSYETCIYKCKKCSINFINKTSIEKHINRCHEKKLFRVKCFECNIDFTRHSLARHKYIHHEYLGLKEFEVHIIGDTKDLYRNCGNRLKPDLNETVVKVKSNESVVSLNDETDNSILIESDDESVENVSISEVAIEQAEGVNNSPDKVRECKLYKCSKCNLCFLNLKTLQVHVYADHPASSKVSCSICYNNFTNQTLKKHTELHHTIGKFNKNEIIIIDCDKRIDNTKTSKLEKKESESAIKIDHSKTDRRRKQYTISEASKESLKETAKNCVYKCKYCGLSLLSFSSAQKHIAYNCGKTRLNEHVCEICELNFSVVSFSKHYYIHHEFLGLGKDDLNVLTFDKNDVRQYKETDDVDTDRDSSVASDMETPQKRRLIDDNDQVSVKSDDTNASTEKRRKINKITTTLFKCSDCKVYFISRATCLKHFFKHTRVNEIEFIECKACNLPFTILTLHKHIQLHHKSEFRLEDVLIEEYTPRPDGKQPIPEIYFAVDKLQSKLVSTTTDREDVIEVGESSGIKAQDNKMVVDDDSSNVRIPDLIAFED